MPDHLAHADDSSPADVTSHPAIGMAGKFPPLQRLWWAAIVLLGISIGAVGWTIWQLRTDAIRAAISDAGNLATLLSGQLSRSLHTIDALLLELNTARQREPIESRADLHAVYQRKTVHDALRQQLARQPELFNLVIADESGQLVVSTAAWPTPDINVADRDYFQAARARTDGQLSTSVPIHNRINGSQTIVFARRLTYANGTFAGVAFASVNSKYFEAIYGSTQSVRSVIFNLIREDGVILFRHPDMGPFVGKKLSGAVAWQNAVANGTKSFRILAKADNQYRYVSVRQVPEYPLFVNVSVTEAQALSGWFRRSATIALGSAVLLLCSIYLLVRVTRQVRSLSASEARLSQKSDQLDAALNNMTQGLSMFDAQQRLVVCNAQYAAMYGLAPDHLRPGMTAREILEARVAIGACPAKENYAIDRLAKVSEPGDHRLVDVLQDGRTIAITHQPMANGGWVSVHQDITAQKRVEAELAHMARYDALTGLANRALFLDKADAALERMRAFGETFAILMLDLDRFKVVNDSLGHAMGDSLLKSVADRLRAVVSEDDTVARLGGDEFAVIQSHRKDQREAASTLGNRILAALTQPYELVGRKISIGTSIGITLAPADASDTDGLIRNADLALYKAKSGGRNSHRFFEPAMEADARSRRELEEDMRRALAREEFELHYQTVIDVARGECCGAEALVRWNHPERGRLAPDQFIGLAESSGLIEPLGAWILRKACTDAVTLPRNLKVAVNLSPAQFKSDLPDVLAATLAATGLEPARLELEITETVLIENNEENLALLHRLKSLGVSIVLDDFGIGYSSMRYLQLFPFDKIKIDKSFIQSMVGHADSAAIVSAIAGLGRSLDVETTAEGVETMEQFLFLRTAGCQFAQGYLFSRPVPLTALSFDRPQALEGVRAA